ncbi:MAG: chromosome segregation protein SMC [Omnitrophica WOR_2 bacterium RIFCSPLOWO2_02_FULL_50_19]|nr:MAG: chromosome segregation protein SMC [Omnitrophica WOR_2 bacterium RIFCSPLOWO2_02_FULL_50_19]
MHFKNLELFGFKSFANKTELNFEPGVTAIVGPNGCGKSNVSDAIKWVLGETSAREIRGTKMEDVIFSGTDGKEALGFAEVSLTIINQPKILPTEYDEVTITRRVFRSGESEYFINKTPVRLKDINELLMGTGIGTSTYSLMEQGRIAELLDSRPEERRYVFEEAAGITKYKAKKREALRKLEQTEANLLRVSDVITEVKRQINSIERQANKARKYKEDFEKLKEMEVWSAANEFRKIRQEEGGISSDRNSLAAKGSELNSIISELDSKLSSLRNDLAKVDQRLSDAKANVVNMEGQVERNRDRISYNSERSGELNARISSLEKDIDSNRERLSNLENEVDRLNSEVGLFKSNEEGKKREIEEKTKYLDAIAEAVKTCQQNIEKAKLYVVDIAQGQTRVHNELTKLVAHTQHLGARQRRIEVEKRKVGEERAAFGQKLGDLVIFVEKISKDIENLNWKKAQAEGNLSTLGEEIVNLEAEFQGLGSELTTSQSRLTFLEDLKAKYEGFSLGVKTVLKEAEKGSQVSQGVIGVVADLIEPFQGYDGAVEAALGDLVQAVVVKDRETAKRLIKFLDEGSLGRATFIPLEGISRSETKTDILNYIKTDESIRSVLGYLLRDTYIAGDLESAFSSIAGREDHVRFITKNGEVVEKGLSAGGKVPKIEGFGLIGRDAKIKELKITIENLKAKSEALEDGLQEKKQLRDSLQTETKTMAEDIHKIQIDNANKISEKASLEEAINKINEEESLLNLELGEANSEIETYVTKEEELKKELASLDDEDAKVQETIKSSQDTITMKLKEREDTLVLITQLKTELDMLKDKEVSVVNALSMMARSLEDERGGLVSKEKEIDDSKARISELVVESEQLAKRNEELVCARVSAESDSQKIFGERKAISDSITQVENEVRDSQKAFNELSGRLHTLEVKTTEFNYKKNSLRDRLVQVYKFEADLEGVVIPEEINWDETNEKTEALRSKLEGMGAVNLVAIEEHQELQERHTFLTTQQQDLLLAKDDLHKAINKLNRTTREMFLETFQKIQVEFRDMFRLLFGGGDAELLLIDQEDILESGIEIIARPPGKKPQSISLLSGGERSMTAIALLFSIFKIKPSPFCVMDEMDAALDEANIDRFCGVLKDFVKTSQFIIITHNKKTISVADVMYGITMEESGVSKIVSVKFSEELEAKTA